MFSFFSSNRLYSLRKSRHILKTSTKWYRKRGSQLSPDKLQFFEVHLQTLDDAVVVGDRVKADEEARKLEEFCEAHFKKNLWDHAGELTLAIIVALAIATIVRQAWFELYEIPTGSMRPTFKEQDHLTVSKTQFGLNIPLQTSHFYFDPTLVERAGIVIWSGDGVPHLDSKSTFMGIFPYEKRFVKRCLGKPGDTLYFYGGRIYGFDKEGKDLVELRENKWMEKIEHIPFTSFEGRISTNQESRGQASQQVLFNHMNLPIGKLVFTRSGQMKGEIYNGQQWVVDRPEALRAPHSTPQTFSDFWGIGNFAIGRLLTKKQAQQITASSLEEMEEGVLYLEIKHTPNLINPSPLLFKSFISLPGYHTLIPLQERHLKALMENMYTSRFVVKDGKASRYSIEGTQFNRASPSFPGVPDGTYEFYYGKAVKVGFGGWTSPLAADHPLYTFDPENVQRLFNLGVEFSTFVDPAFDSLHFPNRYAYFREGDFYLLGSPVIKKDDPTLQNFLKREDKREKESEHYIAFKDQGPPLKEGQLDKEKIKAFGLKIPEGHYLMLGDNHASSQDSRYFGPIPQANLQGVPSLILWPPGERFGCPHQKPYPLLTLPRLIIWVLAALIALTWYWIYRRNLNRSVFKRKSRLSEKPNL